MDSIPGLGRSHTPQGNQARNPQLLSSRAASTEAHLPSSPCSATRDATAIRSSHITRRAAPLTKLEQAHAAMKTQHNHKQILKKDLGKCLEESNEEASGKADRDSRPK